MPIRQLIYLFVLGLLGPMPLLWAEATNLPPHSPSPSRTAAGPRPGPVTVVEVTLTETSDLEKLILGQYDISHILEDTATLYVTAEELGRLRADGFLVQEIAQHPTDSLLPLQSQVHARRGNVAYYNYASLTTALETYATTYPEICRLVSLGQSVQGRELWALLITDNPDIEEDEPEFKYDGTIHGNEPVGMEMCMRLIQWLLTHYNQDERATHLINETAIWIVPLMNPDGLEMKRRYNANGYDLNRTYPEIRFERDWNHYHGIALNEAGRQPETQQLVRWAANQSFTLGASLHTGILVVAYPYATNKTNWPSDSPTPDDALIESLGKGYAEHNLPMKHSGRFADGIVNMASVYIASGTTADWYYAYLGTIELVPELSWIKWPEAGELPGLWEDNRESMLTLLKSAHLGVRGVVTEYDTNDTPLWAEVLVLNNEHAVFTDPNIGDYHRLLLPGTYDLVFHAHGYVPRYAREVDVVDGPATRVDITLLPVQASPDFNQDNLVNQLDLDLLEAHMGQNEARYDIAPLSDGDGIVDELDRDLLLAFWEEEIPDIAAIKGITPPRRR